MVHPISASSPKIEAQVFGDVLHSFMKLFEIVSRQVLTPGDVKKMVDVSAYLRKATFEVVQKTGDPSLQRLFADARKSFSQSYGTALERLKFKQY